MLLDAPNRFFDYLAAFSSTFTSARKSAQIIAIAAGFVASQHQSSRFQDLLNHRQLTLVNLEIDDLPRFRFLSREMMLHLTFPKEPIANTPWPWIPRCATTGGSSDGSFARWYHAACPVTVAAAFCICSSGLIISAPATVTISHTRAAKNPAAFSMSACPGRSPSWSAARIN